MAGLLAIITVVAVAAFPTAAAVELPSEPVEAASVQAERDRLLQKLADELIKGDFKAAASVMTEAGRSAAVQGWAEWTQIEPAAREVIRLPEVVLEAYKPYQGQETTVYLTSGAEKLRIRRVTPTRVRASKQLLSRGQVVGTSSRDFTYADLSTREKMVRLGPEQTPERDIMRGLLALAGKADDTARQFFRKSESELGLLLSERLKFLQARRKAEWEAKRQAAFEQEAAHAYKLILDAAGLSHLKDEGAPLVLAIRKGRFDSKQVKIIKRQRDRFIRKYGKTDLAEAKSEVIRTLGFIRPDMPLFVEQDVLDRVMKQLDEDNPSGTIKPKITIEDDGIILDLNRNEVSDLSALAGLPIKTLYLNSTMVEDLSPLKGMPLLGVDLSESRVWDISPLKNAPLVWLNLSFTKVGDNLQPLQHMKTLRHLHLSNMKPPVFDLSPLRGLQLETLSIQGSRVSSLEPIYGMPLKNFDARPENTRCSIQEIERFWKSVGKEIQQP